jgi:thiosulfate/3-mercaptopyruvate sulfurtransferase
MDDFEAAARRAGIGEDTLVVAYDEAGEGGAARLWWLLRHFGHDGVTVLDGGLRAWREDGGELRAGEERIAAGDFTAAARNDTVTAEELAPEGRAPTDGALLDARAPERYRGEVEPVDAVAGHIPGAVNVPFAEIAPGGRFLPPDELRARLEAAGVRPGGDAVAYCGSGVTAAVIVLAAEVAGIGPVRLYPGSWSEWSGRGLPVERG